MSEYYLADRKAQEREKQRASESKTPVASQDVKVTLLGDFLVSSGEAHGCDPYNSTQGKVATEAWKTRRDRR